MYLYHSIENCSSPSGFGFASRLITPVWRLKFDRCQLQSVHVLKQNEGNHLQSWIILEATLLLCSEWDHHLIMVGQCDSLMRWCNERR